MRLLTGILLQVLLFFSLQSQVNQEWVRRYNGSSNQFDIANSLRVDANSDIYVYGTTSSTGTLADILTVKYNPNGMIVWEKKFSGYGNSADQAQSTFLDVSGNSYITGFTADTNEVIKIVTLKYSPGGNLLWSKVFLPPLFNQGSGQSIAVDNSFNVYTSGYMRRQNGAFSLVVIKQLPGGSIADTVIYNGTSASSETPVSICLDNSSNVYLLASTNAISGFNDILILKYDSNLNLVWQTTFSGTAVGHDMPVQMLLSNNNKLVVCGAMKNSSSGFDYGVYRFDTSSALIMQYVYNGTGNDQDIPYAVCIDDSNNIYVTGSSRNSDTLGSEDFATLKIDPTAFLWWAKRYNGAGMGIDYGTSIAVDLQGNVYAGGTTDKGFYRVEYALLKYSPQGSLSWIEKYSAQERSEDFIYSVALDKSNNVFVTGISFDSLSDYDIATIKYSQTIGIRQISSEVPSGFLLYQNYPNPFNPETNVKFDITSNVKSRQGGTGSETSNVKLQIFNLLGENIVTLVNEVLKPGTYEVNWNASDFPSGLYFGRLITPGYSQTIRMMLIK